MAQIDPSIALNVRPVQQENPMNALARAMQVKALQQQSEVNSLTMQEKQRSIAEGNALTSALRTPGFSWDNEAHRNSAFSAAPTKAQELYKGHLDVENKRGTNKKQEFDLNKERFGVVRKAAAAFANDPGASRERVIATLQAYQVGGVIPEHLATQFAQSLPEDPVQLRQVLLNFAKQDLTSEQLFTLFAPKPTQVDNGQQIGFRDTNPNSPTYGEMTAGGVVQKVASPEAVLSSQTTMRGQNMTDARSRELAAIQRQGLADQRQAARTEIKETADGLVMIDKASGAVLPLKGPDGKPLGPKLKEVPAPVQNSILTNATNLARAERALTLLEGNNIGDPAKGGQKGDKEATGLKGYLPNQVLNRVDPDGVDVRAAIADLGSLVIHERSGAAVTAAEFPRLAPFIPTEKDDHQTAKKKLRRFVQVYKDEMAAMQGTYNRDNGYRAPAGGVAPAAGQVLRFDAQGNPVN